MKSRDPGDARMRYQGVWTSPSRKPFGPYCFTVYRNQSQFWRCTILGRYSPAIIVYVVVIDPICN